jgi:AraC family transcriptional regulator
MGNIIAASHDHLGAEGPQLRGQYYSVQRNSNHAPDPHHIRDIPSSDGFAVIVQLQDFTSHKLWHSSRLMFKGGHPRGSTSIAYLGGELRCQHLAPYDNLRLALPRAALDKLQYEEGLGRCHHFSCPPGTMDPVTYHLSQALLPSLESPSKANQLFVDQVLIALLLHIRSAYGEAQAAPPVPGGQLSPWQLRRAKDLLAEHVATGLTLAQLAQECALSRSYFSRAFKRSTGVTPHEWLLTLRVTKAKELLLQPGLKLSQISLECGFADQAHFCRVFSRITGCVPSRWRNLHGVSLLQCKKLI